MIYDYFLSPDHLARDLLSFLPGGKEVSRGMVHICNFYEHKQDSWLLCDAKRHVCHARPKLIIHL